MKIRHLGSALFLGAVLLLGNLSPAHAWGHRGGGGGGGAFGQRGFQQRQFAQPQQNFSFRGGTNSFGGGMNNFRAVNPNVVRPFGGFATNVPPAGTGLFGGSSAFNNRIPPAFQNPNALRGVVPQPTFNNSPITNACGVGGGVCGPGIFSGLASPGYQQPCADGFGPIPGGCPAGRR